MQIERLHKHSNYLRLLYLNKLCTKHIDENILMESNEEHRIYNYFKN